MNALGRPHLHYTTTGSTNERARALAIEGAPHGTIVTAREQTAGRGRRGRSWDAPAGQALLLSVLLRGAPELLTLRIGLAVADACGSGALLKWPNDVIVGDRKVAGILCEQRPGENWAVAGVGVNVAVDLERLPPRLHDTAGTLGARPAEIPAWLLRMLDRLDRALDLDDAQMIAAWTARDYLRDRQVRWPDGEGVAAGIDESGRLRVETDRGLVALDSGEVSLARVV